MYSAPSLNMPPPSLALLANVLEPGEVPSAAIVVEVELNQKQEVIVVTMKIGAMTTVILVVTNEIIRITKSLDM